MLLDATGSPLKRETHSQAYTVLDLAKDMGANGFAAHGEFGDWQMTSRAALEITTVMACVRVIAQDVASLPFMTYRTEKNGERTPLPDHPVTKLFTRAPNGWMTPFAFMEMLVMQALVEGDAYAYISDNPKSGEVYELIPLQPSMVGVRQDRRYGLVYTVSDSKGVIGEYPANKFLHLRNTTWNGYSGMNVLWHGRKALELAALIEESQISFHRKGGRPSGVLTFEHAMTDEAIERAQKQFAALAKAKGTAILDGSARYYALDTTAADAQQLESRAAQVREICRMFRIMPIKIGEAAETTTYASAEQFNISHANDAIKPVAIRLVQAVTNSLYGGDETLSLGYDLSELRRGDMKTYGEWLTKMASHRIILRNEVRQELGLNPIAGADEWLFPQESEPKSASEEKPKPVEDKTKSDNSVSPEVFARVRNLRRA